MIEIIDPQQMKKRGFVKKIEPRANPNAKIVLLDKYNYPIKKKITLDQAYKILNKNLEREFKSEKSARTMRYFVKTFFKFCEYMEIDYMLPKGQDVINFFDYMEHWAPQTKKNCDIMLRRFYNHDLKIYPPLITNYRPKIPRRKLDVPNQDKLIEFFNSIDCIWDRLTLMLLYSCGVRPGEFVGLRWGDINPDTLVGMLYPESGILFENEPTLKNGDDKREIKFMWHGHDLLRQLFKYKSDNRPGDYIFKISSGALYQMCRKYAIKFGDPKITPYTMRHCFATHLIEAGYNPQWVKELMGQRSIKSQDKYIGLANSEILRLKAQEEPLNDIMQKMRDRIIKINLIKEC